MLQKLLLFILILFAELTVVITNSYAQIIVSSKETCELQTAYADHAASKVTNNSNIIIVSRLGNGENHLKYSQRRLQLIRERVKLTIPTKQIVLVYGGRIKGKGRVELYVNGILEVVFEAPQKRNLGVGDCTVDYNETQKFLFKTKLPRAP